MEQIGQTLKSVEQIQTPSEAFAKLTVSPALMAYEARYALQQVKEQGGGDVEVIEPLARAIGWAEGLAFALAFTHADPSVLAQLPTNGQVGR